MATHVKDRRPGRSRRTFWLDDTLYQQAPALAKSQHSTVTSMIEQALNDMVRQEEVLYSDATLGPVIDRVLVERLGRSDSYLGALLAATAYEVIRTQYVLLNSILEANGVKPDQVNQWHRQGWEYAVKEFKRHVAHIRKSEDQE